MHSYDSSCINNYYPAVSLSVADYFYNIPDAAKFCSSMNESFSVHVYKHMLLREFSIIVNMLATVD